MADDKNSTGKETTVTLCGVPLPSLAKLLKEQEDRQAALEAWERLWDAVRANLEPAVEHFQEIARQFANYADLLCEDAQAYTWAEENRPRWAHLAKHGRSARIRKKYIYRILREYREEQTNGRR